MTEEGACGVRALALVDTVMTHNVVFSCDGSLQVVFTGSILQGPKYGKFQDLKKAQQKTTNENLTCKSNNDNKTDHLKP